MPRDWDAYYSDPSGKQDDPDPLLIQVAEMLPPGRALDLACGYGRHALYLASLGWQVTAVDKSQVVIDQLRAPGVDAVAADL